MSKRFLIVILIILLIFNTYLLFLLNQANRKINQIEMTETKTDEYNNYQLNFVTAVQNSHRELPDITIKDSVGNLFGIDTVFGLGQKQLLVCRFSESHCESCVDFSIKILRQFIVSIEDKNVLFLGTYRNNRIFNRTKTLYEIQEYVVYNTETFNLPVKDLGYPYYFVLHNNLTVSDVFVPDKATPQITATYLKLIKNRYFNEK